MKYAKLISWAGLQDPHDVLATFTGRERELERLHVLLKGSDGAPAFVVGDFGSGKTSLTIAYAQLFQADYSRVVLISCSSIDSDRIENIISSRLRSFSAVAGSRSADLAARWFKKPVLLVVDEADQLSKLEHVRLRRVLDSTLPYTRAILVGQQRDSIILSKREAERVIELSAFSLATALDVLRKYSHVSGLKDTTVQKFSASLAAVRADWTALTPRFILRLFEFYVRTGQIDESLLKDLGTYFRAPAGFAIKAERQETKVLPVGLFEAVDIITPKAKVFTAFPFVSVPSYAHAWRPKLEELEHLLNSRRTTENQIQNFFELNPELLKGVDYEHVIAHPVLEREGDGNLIPDFFLKPRGKELIDIVDLKLPSAKLVSGRKDRKKVSGSVSEALAQVREYRDYFERPEHRERIARKYGVRAYRPTTIVVIGRQPDDLPEEKVKQIFSDLPNHFRLMTYDDVWNRAKAYAGQSGYDS